MVLTQTSETGLKISNSGSNGQFLSKQSGNTGGLTWADVPTGVGGATGLDVNDSVKVRFGTGNDLEIYHDGSNAYIKNLTNNLHIGAYSSGANSGIWFYSGDNDRINLTPDGHFIPVDNNSYDLGSASLRWKNLYIADDIVIKDSGEVRFGNGGDLKIYHDGTDSHIDNVTGGLAIKDTGGYMRLKSDDLKLESATDEDYIACTANGSTELYYDASKKLETQSAGVEISGKLTFANDGLANGSIDLGADADLNLYHDNSNAYIDNNTGHLYIRNDGNSTSEKILLQAKGGEGGIVVSANGNVELYYDDSLKLETTSYGVFVTGTLKADVIDLDDSKKIQLGASDDLQIYHDGSDSNITNAGTGHLYLYANSSDKGIVIKSNSDVELYYDNSLKLETTGNGVYVHGDVSASSQCVRIDNAGSDGSNRDFIRFKNDSGNTAGGIQHSGDTSVSYNTSSDYRLKENEVAISDGITRLKTLKPYRFNFKSQPSKTVDGFFAHEVTAVPEAINGEKDGTEMQSLDYSKLVTLLTAALQEAITKIETLETKVAALESS